MSERAYEMNAPDRRKSSIAGAALLAFTLMCATSAAASPLMHAILTIPRDFPWLGVIDAFPGILIHDIDQDGARELLVANAIRNTIDVYRVADGEPRLTGSMQFPDIPVSMAAADIDRDGTPEIVVATLTEAAGGHIYVGTYRNGTYIQQWRSDFLDAMRYAGQLSIGNVDRSNKEREIVVGLDYRQAWLVYGRQGGDYDRLHSEYVGSEVYSVKVANVIGDQHADVVVGTGCGSDQAIRVYQNYALKAQRSTGGVTNVTTFDPDQAGTSQIIAGIGSSCGIPSRAPAPAIGLFEHVNGQLIERARTRRLTEIKETRVIVAGGRLKGMPVVAAGTLNTYPRAKDAHHLRLFDRNLCELWRYRLDAKEVTFALAIGDIDNDGRNELVAATNRRVVAFKPRTAPWPSCQPSSGSPAGDTDAGQ